MKQGVGLIAKAILGVISDTTGPPRGSQFCNPRLRETFPCVLQNERFEEDETEIKLQKLIKFPC